MAYTIKGLAKANDCESFDCYGLAKIWQYWYVCNCGGRQTILTDFKSLRNAEKQEMLDFLANDSEWADIHTHICANLF